jgi:hypothetical protein
VIVPSTIQNAAAAKQAIDTYVDGWRMTDQASADPSKNWRTQVYKYEADPYAADFLASLTDAANQGIRTVGHNRVSGVMESLSDDTAIIRGCVDTSHQDTVNQAGKSVKAADSPSSRWKYTETATVKNTPAGWRLTKLDSDFSNEC